MSKLNEEGLLQALGMDTATRAKARLRGKSDQKDRVPLLPMSRNDWMKMAKEHPLELFLKFEQVRDQSFVKDVVLVFFGAIKKNPSLKETFQAMNQEVWDKMILIAGATLI